MQSSGVEIVSETIHFEFLETDGLHGGDPLQSAIIPRSTAPQLSFDSLTVESLPLAPDPPHVNDPASELPFASSRRYNIDELRSTITRARLFDPTWYARRYKIPAKDSTYLLEDFLKEGIAQGRNPNPLFDSDFYSRSYMNAEGDTDCAFFHYLTIGAEQSYWPHPLIDAPFVSSQLKRHNISDGVLTALQHKCVAFTLDPHPIFSIKFYLDQYPELRRNRVHPIIHFFQNGSRERKSPHPLFWPEFFIANASADDHSGNYLLSYLQNPNHFSVNPNPYFDVQDYQERYPDLKGQKRNFLYHYLRFGRFEGRSPHPAIDIDWMSQEYRRQLEITNLEPLSFLLTHNIDYLMPNRAGKPLVQTSQHAGDLKKVVSPFGTPSNTNRSRRLRLLFISHNLKIQGAQTRLFELSVGMKRRFGHEVIVLAPDQGPMKEKYRAEDVPVHTYMLPVAGLSDADAYSKLLSQFEEQILDLKPDVVHGNTIQSYHALAIAARHGIPTVWNIRESEEPASHGADFHPMALSLMNETFKAKHRFVFVSGTTMKLWAKAFPAISATAIHNGIDYNRLTLSYRSAHRMGARAAYKLEDEEVVLLSVGTWTERKGQRDIVQALGRVDRRLWPNIRLLLIGANDGTYGRQLLRDIEEAPKALRDRITIFHETNGLAGRAKVLQAYAAADIFVFTSLIESYPRVINEAMFYGLPIVATPCFGVVEQLEANVSTKFYDFGATDQLASILHQMIIDQEMRSRLGGAARQAAFNRVIQYDEMLSRYNTEYRTLLT